ncbi:MAG: geranylgeranylglyceryl/heptaprenylglyceryl phosphate synthase [Bacteroidota bacterium]
MEEILNQLQESRNNRLKRFAVLIDPDKIDNSSECLKIVNLCVENRVDYFMVGGSLMTTNNFSEIISVIKRHSTIPVIIFPGNNMQIDSAANAILFLSLISGRNPEFLIGQHVVAAPVIKRTQLEVIPTGYVLIEAGNQTTAGYMSNTTPIPSDKYSIAACTALAGEMLGLKMIYLDAGSGADHAISQKMISTVRKSIDLPLIVGGGINNLTKAQKALEAGADMIVVGNGIEENPDLLIGIADKIQQMNALSNVH